MNMRLINTLMICMVIFMHYVQIDGCRTKTPPITNVIRGHMTNIDDKGEPCPHVSYAHGLLLNSRGADCTYMINGDSFTTNASAIRIPLHGLLRYSCGSCTGSLIITGACSDCTQCQTIMNEHVCLDDDSHFWAGLSIGLLVTLAVASIGYLTMRWIESRTKNKDTFDRLSFLKRKEKGSDTDTDSDHQLPISSCPPKWMAVCTLLLFLVVVPADSMYQTTTSTYCNDTSCEEYTVVSMTLYDFEPRFLQLKDSSKLEVKITDLHYDDIYHPVYETSDYDLHVETMYQCKGAGDCWNPGQCYPWVKYAKFEWKALDVSSGGCLESSLGCEKYCFHHTACVFYKWKLEPHDQRYQVYEYTMTTWSALLSITINQVTTNVKLTGNKGKVGWYDTLYRYPIEASVSPMITSQAPTMIMNYRDQHISVKGSPLGSPMQGHIGDIQFGDGVTYDVSAVDCVAAACNVTCKHPTPSIRLIDPVNTVKCRPSRGDITCIRNFRGSVEIKLGTNAIAKEVDPKAKCNFDIPITWSCSDCPMPPNFVVKPYDIVSEGSFHVESNCTLSTNTFSCTQHAYTVNVLDGDTWCRLHAVGINKTIVVSIKVIDNKRLNPDYGVVETSIGIWSEVGTMLQSDSFMRPFTTSLMWSINTMLIALVARYILAIWIIKKTAAK